MIHIGEDGKTHINVYSKGATTIGRWLSNFSRTPIEIAEDGKFASIEGYWYWLQYPDEHLRELSGFAAKQLGKKLRKQQGTPRIEKGTKEFEEKICAAIDLKLKADRPKMIAFGKTELPLAHYYLMGGKKIDAGGEWILRHLELRRLMLKPWIAKHNY